MDCKMVSVLLAFGQTKVCCLRFMIATFGALLVLLSWQQRHFSALKFLGPNYSPCFDSYIPKKLVKDGPYQWVRHPMYFAKIILCVGTFIISGSLLFVPIIAWLVVEVIRSISKEEKYLCLSLSNYVEYKAKTKIFVPWVF
jgi:protein-S-isoprenylcysteine O-methyltransferase Ste14